MKISQNQIQQIISETIARKKANVINALKLSDVQINADINRRNLYDIVMAELRGGNEKLIYNLGYVLDDTFDFSPIEEKMSNAGGLAIPEGGWTGATTETAKDPTWWQQNKGNIFSTGANILSNLFGGGKKDTPVPTPPSSNDASLMLMLQQQQAAAQAAAQAAQVAKMREEEARRNNNIIIISIIGAVVLVGGIIAIIAAKQSKKIKN